MYYAYTNLINYEDWIELFGLIDEDTIMQKRILSVVSGAILPIVALGFIKSLVDYIRPEKIETKLEVVETDTNGVESTKNSFDENSNTALNEEGTRSLLDETENETKSLNEIIESSEEDNNRIIENPIYEVTDETKTDEYKGDINYIKKLVKDSEETNDTEDINKKEIKQHKTYNVKIEPKSYVKNPVYKP